MREDVELVGYNLGRCANGLGQTHFNSLVEGFIHPPEADHCYFDQVWVRQALQSACELVNLWFA